jgi:hypothetical protein
MEKEESRGYRGYSRKGNWNRVENVIELESFNKLKILKKNSKKVKKVQKLKKNSKIPKKPKINPKKQNTF